MLKIYKLDTNLYQGALPKNIDKDLISQLGEELAVISLLDRLDSTYDNEQPSDNNVPYIYCRFPISDGPFPGIKWLDMVVKCIANLIALDKKVYVHCYAGISRSTMVSAAYLMKTYGWIRDYALEYIAKINPRLDPNSNFLRGLNLWQDHITKSY